MRPPTRSYTCAASTQKTFEIYNRARRAHRFCHDNADGDISLVTKSQYQSSEYDLPTYATSLSEDYFSCSSLSCAHITRPDDSLRNITPPTRLVLQSICTFLIKPLKTSLVSASSV